MMEGQALSRKKKRQADKELHDFIFSIESSAKKVLKDATKRKKQEASRARLLALQNRTKRKRQRGEVRYTNISVEEEDMRNDGPEGNMNVEVPAISQASQAPKKNQQEKSSHTPQLPQISSPRRSKSHAAAIIARVQKKLSESPLAATTDASKISAAGKEAKVLLKEVKKRKEKEAEAKMKRKPRLVHAINNDREMIKVRGHFAPGTVASRAEHAVPRRLALSMWLDPEKKTSLDKGLSSQALKALTQANELQGPTNWSSVDLRLKYRDELKRTEAWEISCEREAEAERLRKEEGTFIPVVLVTRHPFHVDFEFVICEENRQAANRARARNRLKAFSYDMPVIWSVNRPANPLELLDQARSAEEGEEDEEGGLVHESYPPQYRGVGGLIDRRDKLAHEAANCQVQSVTGERAMRGAKHTPNDKDREYIVSIQAKIQKARSNARLANMVTGKPTIKSAKRQKIVHPEDMKDAVREQAFTRCILFVDAKGLLAVNRDKNSVDDAKEGDDLLGRDAILISVFYRPSDGGVSYEEEQPQDRPWVICAYSAVDSTEYKMYLSESEMDEFLEQRQTVQHTRYDHVVSLYREKAQHQAEILDQAVAEGRHCQRARWWFVVSLASRSAHVGQADGPEDQYAQLAGFSKDEARSCIQQVDKWLAERSVSAELVSIVHRQAIHVLLSSDGSSKGEEEKKEACLVVASVAAIAEDDPETTCVVVKLLRLGDMAQFSLCFSVSAIRKWMVDTKLSEQVDIPPTLAKWWLLRSEWKTNLFRAFFSKLCFQLDGTMAFVPGLAIAHAAVQYERYRMITESIKCKISESAEALSKPPEFQVLSKKELMNDFLTASSEEGGLGILEKMWTVRRVRFGPPDINVGKDEVEEEEEEEAEAAEGEDKEDLLLKSMALLVSGRKPGSRNYIGGDPPSTSLKGRISVVVAMFTRDRMISSTNSVTCVLSTSLDNPLLAPTVMSCDPEAYFPAVEPEYLDLPKPEECPIYVSPFVVRSVISKLDFRESVTMLILNASATEKDLGSVAANSKYGFGKNEASAGHRRLDPEITQFNFRSRFTAALTELCKPDPVFPGMVFGITETSATLNAADVWPFRYTWHSDELTVEVLTRPRDCSDYAYVNNRGATVGSNDPNGYRSDMRVEECEALVRVSKTEQVKLLKDLEQRLEHEEKDKVLLARLEAARKSAQQSEEQRALLDQELNDKRLAKERRLRGKANGAGARNEDWLRRVQDPGTKKLGRWKLWQAYLYLDQEAKAIIVRAAEQVELDQLARIAAGARPVSQEQLKEEAFALAVKEGTLFYHEEREDIYQWDQPVGWEGVATIPPEFPDDDDDDTVAAGAATCTVDEKNAMQTETLIGLRHDDSRIQEEALTLGEDYNPARMAKLKEKELAEIRARDAQVALEAAGNVEHSRRLRRIEENMRNWLDARSVTKLGAFDLRFTFQEMDPDRTGVLSYDEFRLGMANMELELPLEDQDTIIRHLDRESDNRVDYLEWIHWMVYVTRANSKDQWLATSISTPELGPNTWAQKAAQDNLLASIGPWHEYKDSSSGQHYYFNSVTKNYQWVMPEEVAVEQRQSRDARELRQAQEAASLAARAAAESAEQAQRASERSMERIVEQLSSSSAFVQLVAKELGFSPELLSQERKEKQRKEQEQSILPPLKLPRLSKAQKQKARQEEDDLWEQVESTDDDDDDEHDHENDDNDNVDAEKALSKPGVEWRLLRPGVLKEGFITRAFKPNTRGADMQVFSSNMNNTSLVGVVDPADVSHIPFEDFPPVETKFISDIMEDTLAQTDQTAESLLDRSDEDKMIEMVQDTFLAIKNSNFEKVVELLDLGVKVSETDENGNTMLLAAAQQGNKRLVKFSLRRGADINAQNLKGNTALHFCFQYGFQELAEYLISKGADDSLLNADNLTCYEGLHAASVDAL